jgi:hypothetical protein
MPVSDPNYNAVKQQRYRDRLKQRQAAQHKAARAVAACRAAFEAHDRAFPTVSRSPLRTTIINELERLAGFA